MCGAKFLNTQQAGVIWGLNHENYSNISHGSLTKPDPTTYTYTYKEKQGRYIQTNDKTKIRGREQWNEGSPVKARLRWYTAGTKTE